MDRSLWGLQTNQKDHLVFGGCDLVELGKEYGTPLYVVDTGRLRSNSQRFVNSFRVLYPKVKVFYSYKTNCVPGVLKIIHDEGLGAEVSSPYELWLTSQLGVKPTEVFYSGVNKTEKDLINAINKGVGYINIDSVGELIRLKKVSEELKSEINVGIRVYPEVGWKGQFGLQPFQDNVFPVLQEFIESDWVKLNCLHMHIGTGISRPKEYEAAIVQLCFLIKEFKKRLNIDVELINIGGGFGISTVKRLDIGDIALYKLFDLPPSEPSKNQCPPIEVFGKRITEYLLNSCTRYGIDEPFLLLEPGRAISSDAQILLLSVVDIKTRGNGRKFALMDGGQNIAYPLSYEYHKCFVANRANAEFKDRYSVTGPLCSPGDLLYRNWKFPGLNEGDMLAIMDAGAYFTSFSYSFSFSKPAVVLVSNGDHELARQHESFEYMTALDLI